MKLVKKKIDLATFVSKFVTFKSIILLYVRVKKNYIFLLKMSRIFYFKLLLMFGKFVTNSYFIRSFVNFKVQLEKSPLFVNMDEQNVNSELWYIII